MVVLLLTASCGTPLFSLFPQRAADTQCDRGRHGRAQTSRAPALPPHRLCIGTAADHL